MVLRILLAVCLSSEGALLARRTLPSLYPDRALFESTFLRARRSSSRSRPTGLIVPHHLLARQLIASGFASAASPSWKRIVILCPDHFHAGRSPVSVVDADFSTPFGIVRSDGALIKTLCCIPGVRASDFFYREHGIASLLPYIKHYMPNASVCAIPIRNDASRSVLDQLIASLKARLDRNTLVIQSTDFSHYLPLAQAEAKDAETQQVLLEGDPGKAFTLGQPGHIDSVAALYVQMQLQQAVYHSRAVALDHQNSQTYVNDPLERTTSYFVVRYQASPH
jgi:AmmeMemoRadiSam system protein B